MSLERQEEHFHERSADLQIPRLPPDFLSGLVASVNLVRLSLKKAAYVAVDWCCVVGNPEFARDDKGEGGASMGTWLVAEKVRGEEMWGTRHS
jgi:hypothetical protein